MTDYSPTATSVDGTTHTYNPAAAGDKITRPGAGCFITVKNGGGSSVTLTITPPGTTRYGVANPVKIFSIPASGEKDIPILPAYSDPADAYKVALAWSATASVTFAVKRMGTT
ncbi:hypothetical protein [Actinomadura rudentiformis]|uniref:Uncharacterized protein n=1 Tax=Actinomadura rudentiformis TaxID=359158 RepID=A0A6H9Z0G0_9ACTN|nr:hypothetical protein [Actinomadura rudentiformis]KAB2347351.1 hypothetical protein F8566_20275 [Actinomadura rudentiformis]